MNQNFSSTRWSLIARARGNQPRARQALTELCEKYWFPLYAFARRKCAGVEEAQDLTQAFFVDLLERALLQRADPARGKFRTFLLATFQNFASHERERQSAKKRGGGRIPLSLDFDQAESRLAIEPASHDDPQRYFERLWAMQILDSALSSVQQQYEARGNADLFEGLKPFMLGDQGDLQLKKVAEQFGLSASATKVALHRLRARYRDALRAEICATLADENEADDEIRRLFSAFA